MKRLTVLLAALMALGVAAAPAFGNGYTYPSTNDANRAAGGPHVNVVDTDIGEVTLEFVNPKSYVVCFEYRTDGDTSQAIDSTNYNPAVDDLYPFFCMTNDTRQMTFTPDEYVEVRSTFGAERDWDFDWTAFAVGTRDDCKQGGWMDFGFENQGQCIRYANTGKDSR